jgi:dTDP-4-amino-4,6-dideoxygalactose transaminase
MRVRKEFLVFGAPAIEFDDMREVLATLKSGWLGTGPRTKRFEADFAAYKGATEALALNSATAGLHLACLSLDLQPGDEVITTAMTFCATVNTIIHAGGTPVLADIDPQTWNIDPADIERRITSKTRAIVVVHFAGRPCDMDAIAALARRHNLAIIEDCAHAVETEYHGQKAGTMGDVGVFSFYATKNVVTGEGGMVIATDAERLAKMRVQSLHGLSRDAWKRFSADGFKHYYVEEAGYKYNMTDMQAALGIHQLKRVENNWLRRQAIWDRYMKSFAGLPLGLPAAVADGERHAYHLFQVLLDEDRCGIKRDAVLQALHERNIGSGVHYLSIAAHPFYCRTFGWDPAQYPHAATFGEQTLSLPISPKMSDQDVEDVIAAVSEIVTTAQRREPAHAA